MSLDFLEEVAVVYGFKLEVGPGVTGRFGGHIYVLGRRDTRAKPRPVIADLDLETNASKDTTDESNCGSPVGRRAKQGLSEGGKLCQRVECRGTTSTIPETRRAPD